MPSRELVHRVSVAGGRQEQRRAGVERSKGLVEIRNPTRWKDHAGALNGQLSDDGGREGPAIVERFEPRDGALLCLR